MILNRPGMLIVIGFFLVLMGFIGPFLMTIKILETTFFLSFLSYAASVAGLFLGVIGSALYIKTKRKP